MPTVNNKNITVYDITSKGKIKPANAFTKGVNINYPQCQLQNN